jgi:hypothetical protein
MDIEALRTKAIEETSRFFVDKLGYVPDQDSEEFEEEYRRQFSRVKALAGTSPPATAKASPAAAPPSTYVALSGTAAELRWATAIREDRLREVQPAELREWLGAAWTRAKDWLDTRDLPAAAFLQRVAKQYAPERQKRAAAAEALADSQRKTAAAAAELAEKLRAANITARSLVELIDLSPRTKPGILREKLAELEVDGRRLRVFETTDPGSLLVKETVAEGRDEYGIESDAGLIAELKLFGTQP